MANSNERKRMQQINQGYKQLQELVPDTTDKMSKVGTSSLYLAPSWSESRV